MSTAAVHHVLEHLCEAQSFRSSLVLINGVKDAGGIWLRQ